MKIEDKIFKNTDALQPWVKKVKKNKKKVVLCQGHFNVIHPGHLRFLEFAGKQGDYLLIAIQGRKQLEPRVRDKFFNEKERARGVASLEGVDKVIVFNELPFQEIIESVKPDIYVRGEEFAGKSDMIRSEVNLVEKCGGKVMFRSGEVRYATTDFLEYDSLDITEHHHKLFREALKKQKISVKKLNDYCDKFKKLHILVIGDTIVDQYIACDALGMSAEAPVLVVRELESKEYVGGAAVVSRHVAAMGAKCSFISVIGKDGPGELVRKVLKDENISTNLIMDSDRPTTFKIRYMVGPQKILRVTRLQDHYVSKKIEAMVIESMESLAGKIDGIIVSDFVYGVINPGILKRISGIAKKHGIKLFGDVQSSSQIGNVVKFNNFDLLTPTEREARIAMDDKYSGLELLGANLIRKTNTANLVITLADKGFISFQYDPEEDYIKSQHFPALTVNPVDVLGAGDASLSGFSLGLCAGAGLMGASAIAAGVASMAVSKVGNTPVTFSEVKKWLKTLENAVK